MKTLPEKIEAEQRKGNHVYEGRWPRPGTH